MAILDNAAPLAARFGAMLMVIFIALFICAILVLAVYFYMQNKRYKRYKAFIFKRKHNKDGTKTLVFVEMDAGGILLDRKIKKRFFKLKKNKVHLGEEETEDLDENREMDIPSIPSETGGELVFIEKLGPKKFAFADPNIVEGEVKVFVSEADCAEAIRSYDINAKYYGGKDWHKWVGPIAFAVFAVLIIVMIAVVLQRMEMFTSEGIRVIVESPGTIAAMPSNVPG